MEHTKGKWEVKTWKYADTDTGGDKIMVITKEHAIAQAVESYHPNGDARAEAKANARLIAAAPDLLAACKDVRLELKLLLGLAKLEKDKVFRNNKLAVVEQQIQQVEQAIAKATA